MRLAWLFVLAASLMVRPLNNSLPGATGLEGGTAAVVGDILSDSGSRPRPSAYVPSVSSFQQSFLFLSFGCDAASSHSARPQQKADTALPKHPSRAERSPVGRQTGCREERPCRPAELERGNDDIRGGFPYRAHVASFVLVIHWRDSSPRGLCRHARRAPSLIARGAEQA